MKKISIIILCSFVFTACQHEDYSPQKGSAIFSLSTPARTDPGRTQESSLPTAVLLSIKDADGNFVIENKKMPLYAFGQSFVTENIDLTIGHYSLTQLQVLDASNTIIYAAPMKGSELALLAKNPLPIEFDVAKDEATTISPEVFAVSPDDTPGTFGYVSFGFEIVPLERIKSVLITDTHGGLQTKFNLNYAASKITSALVSQYYEYNDPEWPDELISSFVEKRSYTSDHKIAAIEDDKLKTIYQYNTAGKISTKTITYSGQPYQLWSYTYEGGLITEIVYKESSIEFTDKFKYDIFGNIVSIKSTAKNEYTSYLIAETTITYTDIKNPLKGVIELPIAQPRDYPDLIFYTAKHLPSLLSVKMDMPIDAKKVKFEYGLDGDNRPTKISASAFDPALNSDYQKSFEVEIAYKE